MTLRLLLAATLLLLPTALAAEQQHAVYLHEYTGGLHIVPEEIRANVGDTLRFDVLNQGTAPHNLIVCGDGTKPQEACTDRWGFTPMLEANQSAPLTFTIEKAGTFDYYCSIPGHKGGGMKGLLIVSGGDESSSIPALPVAGVLALLATLALVGRRRA